MTDLPTPADEAAMVAKAREWVEIIDDKLAPENARDWLFDALCDRLRRGMVDVQVVVDAADAGDDIADAALRHVDAEMRDNHVEAPVTLQAYAIKAAKRGAVKRSRGRRWHRNFRRDIGIAILVLFVMLQFGLNPTRNREQRRRCRPSAASVAAAALGPRHGNPTEMTVANIWLRRQRDIALYLTAAAALETFPSNRPI
jgi:hypothetical protein